MNLKAEEENVLIYNISISLHQCSHKISLLICFLMECLRLGGLPPDNSTDQVALASFSRFWRLESLRWRCDRSASGESLLPGLQRPAFSLWPHMAFPQCRERSCSSYKATILSDRSPSHDRN